MLHRRAGENRARLGTEPMAQARIHHGGRAGDCEEIAMAGGLETDAPFYLLQRRKFFPLRRGQRVFFTKELRIMPAEPLVIFVLIVVAVLLFAEKWYADRVE